MIVLGSFLGKGEIIECFGGIFLDETKLAVWHVIPQYPTLWPYVNLLLDSPEFFVMFWNSCKQVFPSIFGQLLIALPAAWSFSRFEFRGKKLLFYLYIVLMIMPFQVTMVSSYLVLERLNLLDRHVAIIIPNLFATFPVFILVKFFRAIPMELIEAAQIDGASEGLIFRKIGLPNASAGIISVVTLGFIEYWNALEQPLTFLKSKSLWPLSLYLPEMSVSNLSVSFVASVIMLIPACLIFLFGQQYLEEGIVASGLKQ
ncbi:carbohydrate ABC transporter permease [Candidatus Galacturonibacter soehngenii]|uniref:Carbohydrate ABC transporter permease n=2 Tax=Candidatus Galacturonatibacter soehngenii TaxID=2307010 RepID=A0A7V7QLA8_9FIRM|nr:carbohydrate ABC transporter permease [Candidatus Galacturonibacter soehngenii]